MRSTNTAAAVLLAGAALVSTPALAQMNYGAQAAPQQPAAGQPQAAAPAAKQGPEPKVSREAVKAIQALQTSVNANNAAEIPANVAAANAVAKTADDKYMIGALEYKYAAAAKNDSMRAEAIEQMLASGFTGAPQAELYADLGSTYTRMKQDQRASAAYQHALQLDPNNVAALADIAEAKIAAGQTAEGIALLQKGIAMQSTGGAKAPESWYKRALAIAYKSKLPQSISLSRDWIQAYPTSDAWTNALAIYQNIGSPDEATTLDLMRLKRTLKILTPGDYFNYGDIAVRKGYAGEAKSVLDEGFGANLVKKSDPSFSQLYTLANQKSQGDLQSLPAAPVESANSHQTLAIGDAYYGYGEYAKAADFDRAALAKPGADASVVNLHLGMALARQGDKAGAAAAFAKVTGTEAEVAKFWLLYTQTHA
jgi:tetratricopeptide (TPR) repeat protein